MSINIINTIGLIRKNKKYFPNDEEYVEILTNLYNELSCEKNNKKFSINKDDEILMDFNLNVDGPTLSDQLYENFLNDYINMKSGNDIINKMFSLGIEQKHPLLNMLFLENNLITDEQYNKLNVLETIQKEPLIKRYNKNKVISEIKLFLHLNDLVIKKEKAICFMMTYNLLFQNYKFVMDHTKFFQTVKNKINSILNVDIETLKDFCLKYKIDVKIFENWAEILNNAQL